MAVLDNVKYSASDRLKAGNFFILFLNNKGGKAADITCGFYPGKEELQLSHWENGISTK